MSLPDTIINAATGAGGAGIVLAIVQGVFSYRSRRADAARTESDTWLNESKEAFDRLEKQCDDCKKELRDAKQEHRDEIAAMRQQHRDEMAAVRNELSDFKLALIRRTDVVDELLPYVDGLPEAKLRELRRENQAVKFAIVRAQP
ncbi:hypothetical protein [Mycobacterium asiaticum]|uniref:hypothetical protein n=1 Tax=Mycobacterium asiaticum TaxID=1790 RepID=UPI0007EF463D|nr:hypothetical protein [Mycobacterium asiaticum]OBJ50624.1 hypothetical protein A9W94_28155 [Mycobacterium asiaticum]